MKENPYSASEDNQTPVSESTNVSSGKAAYNVVTDTVTGLNVRKQDNRFQAIFIAISVLICALLGAVLALMNPRWNLPWYGGVLIFGFIGLVAGVLLSGVFLMVFRMTRHLKGKHD